MKIVTCQSLAGGHGATTVVANLATALHRQRLSVTALDMCDSNSLRLHFGMPLEDTDGWYPVSAAHEADAGNDDSGLEQQIFVSDNGTRYIPFGYANAVGLSSRLTYLNAGLNHLHGDVLVVDIPTNQPDAIAWAQQHSDLHLLVITPEPRTYGALINFSQRFLSGWRERDNLQVIFNQVQAVNELNRELLDVLQLDLDPDRQVPMLLHKDQHLPEALATQQSVHDYALSSQAHKDYSALALWVMSQLQV